MAKGTGLIKARERYKKLTTVFPERAEFYAEQLAIVEEQIISLGICRRCGRPLKNAHAMSIGYGKECEAQALAELEAAKHEEAL